MKKPWINLARPALKAGLAVLFASLFVFNGLACKEKAGNGKKGGADKKGPVPVTVSPVVEKSVATALACTGHVEPGMTVNVRSRVSGELDAVHFTSGSTVKAGDLLFTIDPAPFRAKLNQARAELAQNQARKELAERLVARNTPLSEKGFISQDEFDQLQSDVTVLAASIQADQAAVESAELELSYCSIRAVAGGIAGNIAVDPGNLVSPSDQAPMVTIKRISPLDVAFPVPEQHLAAIREGMASGPLRTGADIPGKVGKTAWGELYFIDNAIDPATGMVQLKARFLNGDKALWPGQFVRVSLDLALSSRGLAVPSQAVQTGQNGTYVYVLKEDSTVEYRDVTVDRTVNGDSLISKGLSAGEQVVVDGQLKISPGARVTVAPHETAQETGAKDVRS